MKKILMFFVSLFLCTVLISPSFAENDNTLIINGDKNQVKPHHITIGGSGGGDSNNTNTNTNNNNNNSNTNTSTNNNTATSTSTSSSSATGGNAQVGDITASGGAGGNAEGGSVDLNNVGFNGSFIVEAEKNWPEGITVQAPGIQPRFDKEVEDGSEFSNHLVLELTRDMAQAAIPESHPIQGFFKKLRPLTGIFDLKDSKPYSLAFIPKDHSFKTDREATDKIQLFGFWDDSLDFRDNYMSALEKGYVYVWLGKMTGKAAEDADMLLNAIFLEAMDRGMTYYVVDRFVKKKVATSVGNNLVISGDLMGANGNAWRADAGSASETSHVYNDLINSQHVLFFTEDPVRANELLAGLKGFPPLQSDDERFDNKYVFKSFPEPVHFIFNKPDVYEDEMPKVAQMGRNIVADWDFTEEYGLQPVIMVHRDERGPKGKRANQNYNGGLGLASGKQLRDMLRNDPDVQAFLEERGISEKEWNKKVAYATTGSDIPLYSNAKTEKVHKENRTAYLVYLPGGVHANKKPITFDSNEDR